MRRGFASAAFRRFACEGNWGEENKSKINWETEKHKKGPSLFFYLRRSRQVIELNKVVVVVVIVMTKLLGTHHVQGRYPPTLSLLEIIIVPILFSMPADVSNRVCSCFPYVVFFVCFPNEKPPDAIFRGTNIGPEAATSPFLLF